METKVPTPTRKPRGFKIALIIVAVLFLLFVGVIVLLPYFLPMDMIRGIAKTKAKELAGVDVDFKSLGFGWSGSVVIDGISVAPLREDGSAGEPLLTVGEGRANISLLPLLSGKIVVNSVTASDFTLRLVRNPDGTLNLPDFSNLPATAASGQSRRSRERIPLSAHASEAAPAASAMPPIELHRVDLRNGILAFDDQASDMVIDIALDFLTVEGSDLNEPFLLQGRIFPYPEAKDKGEIPFAGRVAVLRNGAFNPNGEANLEIDLKGVSLRELAEKIGLGDILASGQADGFIKAAFVEGKGALSIADLRFAKANIGIGGDKIINVPDTTASLNAQYDPSADTLVLGEMSLTNALTDVRGRGLVEGIMAMADTGAPAVSVDFAGVADFAKATGYLTAQGMGIEGMPTLEGNGSFTGKLALPRRDNPADPLAPTFTLDFNDGALGAVEPATGIAATMAMKGVGVRAAASIADQTTLNAGINLQNVPLRATVPQIGRTPVDVSLNGGLALASSAETTAVEARFTDTLARVPQSPWATAMEIKCPEARVTYDLGKDVASIQAMTFTINETIQGAVSAGVINGILAGTPQGQADIEFRALLEQMGEVFKPMIPEVLARMSGSTRSVTRVKLEGGVAEALTRAEIDQAAVVLNVDPGNSQAQFDSPKATLGLLASLKLDNPLAVTINTLEVNGEGATVRYADRAGNTLAGRLGAMLLKAAGAVDALGMNLYLSGLSVDVNGVSMAIGQGGQQIGGLTGGLMKVQGPTPEQPLVAPLSGEGDFNVPALDIGAENLVFFLQKDGQREDSNFGVIRAKLGVDGHIGGGKRQYVNLHTATLQSNTIAASAVGKVDLDAPTVEAEYAARLAPAGMGSLLGYLGLPPAILADAEVSGALSWNGSDLVSRGAAKGQLRLSSGEVNPFEMNHDLSASVNKAEQSLSINIKRLDGNVKTPNGDAVAQLATHPSELLLSRAGSSGLLDIRVQGSAGPTRQLALGLVGMIPQLGDYSNLLYQSVADGVYQGWLQVQEKGSNTLGLNLGGVWQGAALQIGNTPYVAEAGNLSVALEGEYAYRDNVVRMSRLYLRSDSGLMQADGTAQASLATGPDQSVSGLANVGVNLRFIMVDLQKAAMVFPGVMPANLGLTGRVEGAFRAGGDAHDIRVEEGVVRFQGFQATPSPDLVVAIPDGTANFGATLSLTTPPAGGPASDYEVFRMFNLAGGQAALTGASVKGKPVEAMSAAFDLQNGVLALRSAQLRIAGDDASVQADGTVDFNGAVPAVSVRLAARNIPMSEVNSEIEQFASIESGVIHLPAQQGQAASVAFAGFSEDEILRTLRLDNFTFATGPVVLHTGPALNAELDKARALLRMEQSGDARVITMKTITGSVQASGNGVIVIPHEAPINVEGDNTGDFRAWGEVNADHTLHIKVAVVGKLENIIGFSIPNLIPNLRSGSEEDRNRFMAKLNQNAANEHYSLRITGPLDSPDISGIGAVAGALVRDVFAAAPTQILGGIADLGKDTPGALLDAAGAILSAPGQAVKSPGSVPGAVIRAPENTLRGIGRAFGVGGRRGSEDDGQDQDQGQDAQPEEQAPAEEQAPHLFR